MPYFRSYWAASARSECAPRISMEMDSCSAAASACSATLDRINSSQLFFWNHKFTNVIDYFQSKMYSFIRIRRIKCITRTWWSACFIMEARGTRKFTFWMRFSFFGAIESVFLRECICNTDANSFPLSFQTSPFRKAQRGRSNFPSHRRCINDHRMNGRLGRIREG